MANPKDEKGAPRPGDTPAGKRPYATLDLQATEVGDKSADGTSDTASSPGFGERARQAFGSAADFARDRFGPLGTHLGAGVLGALIVLMAAYLLMAGRTPDAGQSVEMRALAKRLADVETMLGSRPGDTSGLRTQVQSLTRSMKEVGDAQAQLTKDAKAGTVPPDIVERIAKLEQGTTRAITDQGDAAAKAATAAVDRDLAGIRTEAARLSQRIDAVKGDVDERMRGAAKSADVQQMQAKIAAVEKELQAFQKGEADRSANSARVLLSLELAGLKRVMDRGEPYTSELTAVRSAASDRLGIALDLKPLERHMREGVPTTAEIAKSFGGVSNSAIDAEAQPANGSFVDRLVSGARSIVRVRKSGHSADDNSAEAVVARMDTALREGRLAEVLEQGKSLPPKAALAAEDWLRQVEARQTVDRAMADIEGILKASVTGQKPAGVEPRR